MFERFTASAREVVVAARHEATQLGHRYIGTEHLLLGLVAIEHLGGDGSPSAAEPPAGPVGRVLAAAGIRSDYVKSEIARLIGVCPGGLGEDEADALHSIGIDLDTVRSKLEDSFGEGVLDQAHGAPAGGRLPFTPRAKKALASSLREARRLGHDHLGVEHILLGLIREADGVAGQILATKAPLRILREQLLNELTRAA